MGNKYRHWYAILVLAIALTGCASVPKLSYQEVINQNEKIAELEHLLKDALSKGVDYLAPEGYKSAQQSLESALSSASNHKKDIANTTASTGLDSLKKAQRDTTTSRDILAEVLLMRERAAQAGAVQLFGLETAKLKVELSALANLVERNRLEKAKRQRPDLIKAYADLELAALKETTIDTARALISIAKEEDADRHAPKTLKLAEEELILALSILEADRTQTDKANRHAKKSQWHAERSRSLTEIAKDFDRRDYSSEDILLWHQQQLSDVYQPLGNDLPFNQPDKNVILTMQHRIAELISKQKESSSLSAQAEAKLQAQTALNEEEVNRLRQDRDTQAKKDREKQQQFEGVQSLFVANEANVYRQRQNVLISAHGFRFPSGGSEIESNNFVLLNKIKKAINIFPNARVQVSGHTDATGQDNTNRLLSSERAEKVMKFLIEIGGFSAAQLTAQGYGESRPVASNKTREGRAANRRVEILIIN